MNAPEYKVGEQPRKYQRDEPITFPCRDYAQAVAPENVDCRLKSEFV